MQNYFYSVIAAGYKISNNNRPNVIIYFCNKLPRLFYYLAINRRVIVISSGRWAIKRNTYLADDIFIRYFKL